MKPPPRYKILSVVGARPNFMKVAPLHRAFSREPGLESVIVHTGQHYDARMSQVFFDQLGLPEPQHFLGIGGGTHTEQTANIMLAFEKVLDIEKPDLVIVVGDVNSTLACTLTAVKKQIKVAHVEAGLRSGDRRMPEEINRIVTDAICDLLFVSEQSGVDNLLAEGIARHKIHFVGNIMIDSLVHMLPQSDQLDIQQILTTHQIADGSGLETSGFRPPYVLITMHRPSNVDSKESLQKILQLVEGLALKATIIFSVHPRTRKNLEVFRLFETLRQLPNVILTQPLGYLEFVKVMKEARLIITDSGGVQEETTFLKVPCITFRQSTERPSTITHGTNRLIKDLDVEEAIRQSLAILQTNVRSPQTATPLWDGHTAERILQVLQGVMASTGQING